MNEERRLKKVKIGLMRHPKFKLYQGVMMLGKVSVDDNVPTACTDGQNEKYGRGFINMLDDKELGFIVMHETMHKVLRQLTIWKKLWEEDRKLANCACDYVINLMLHDIDPCNEIIAMPQKDGEPMGFIDEKYRGMNSKQIFDLLKEKWSKRKGKGEGEGEGEAGGEGGGLDEHDWEGEGGDTEEAKEARRLFGHEVEKVLRQSGIGSGTGGLNRELGELLTPQVNWADILQEFVMAISANKNQSSWRKVNRRFLGAGGDCYMPSLIGEAMDNIVIGVDTSGSIDGAQLNKFMSEVQAVVNNVTPNKVHLIYWDSRVASHEEYTGGEVSTIIDSTKPKGGGGTDPTSVQDYLIANDIKPECILMLTDGYVPSWGDKWNAPVLWCISGNENTFAPVGKTVHIN